MEKLSPNQSLSGEAGRRVSFEGTRALGASALTPNQQGGNGPSKFGGLTDSEEFERLYENWQDEANCRGVDPDLFFPEHGESTREAKEICRGCVVRLECLDFAISNGEKFGIWGGLSERERRRLRRQRALAARKVTA